MCQLPTLSVSLCMTKCAKPDILLKQWKKQFFGQIPRTNTDRQTQQLVFPQTPRDECARRLFHTHTDIQSPLTQRKFNSKGFHQESRSLSQHACQTSKAEKLKHIVHRPFFLFLFSLLTINIPIALASGYLQKHSLSTLTVKNIQESFVVKVENKVI